MTALFDLGLYDVVTMIQANKTLDRKSETLQDDTE